MDNDEAAVLVISAVITLVAAVNWLRPLFSQSTRSSLARVILFLTPALCLAACWLVLYRFADHEVRENPLYQVLFVCCAAVTLLVTNLVMRCVGVSARDDALARSNAAAVVTICGAFAGATLCYSGANIGEGPTIWTTLGPAAAGLAVLFVLWMFHAGWTGLSDRVTIDRDVATAVRAAGLYVATGVIVGRAVAGDWIDLPSFGADLLHQAWPALPLMVAAGFVDRVTKPTVENPRPSRVAAGLLPAIGYLAVAGGVLLVVGAPLLRGHR